MLRFKSHLAGLFLAIAALGLSVPPAHAILTTGDLNASGDGLVLFDSATNLEWLAVTATLGNSYNTNLGTAFVTTQGFNYANTSQVAQLFINAGIPGVVQSAGP